MVYNSQAYQENSAWRFTLTKKIDTVAPGISVSVTEEDGSVTIFRYDPNEKVYVATGLAEGRETLKQNPDNTWTLESPGTGITTEFASTREQIKTTDRLGRSCNFHYETQNDTEKQLTQIDLPSEEGTKRTIEFTRGNNTITVSCREGNKTQTLSTYTFNEQQRLTQTSVPLNKDQTYEINYHYDEASNCLKRIEQTDGTALDFTYQDDDDVYLLDSIKAGGEGAYRIEYELDSGSTTVTDPRGGKTEYYFDEVTDAEGVDNFLLHRITHSVSDSEQEALDFGYTSENLLQEKKYSSGVVENFGYDALGLLNEKKDGLGHDVQQFRDPETGVVFSVVTHEKTGDETTALVHRFIYDTRNNQQKCVGEITPEGFVARYDYDEQGNRISARGYLGKLFDTNDTEKYPVDKPISVEVFNPWCAAQDVTQTRLVDFGYNDRGQCIEEKHYATLKPTGEGIEDEKTHVVNRTWDEFGNRLSESVRQSLGVTATDSYDYDGLQRLISHVDALKQSTGIQYEGAQHQIVTTLPNGLVRTVITDASGLIVEKHETAVGESDRVTHYRRNEVGRVYEIQQPDGTCIHRMYDDKGRLCYEVNSEFYVTEYQYDDRDHVIETIHYFDPISPTSIKNINWKTITATAFAKLITVVEGKDRVETYLYDNGNRLKYTINGENAIIEHVYDDANREIGEKRYATALGDASRTLAGVQDFLKDHPEAREKCFYRDKDGRIVEERDEAGYWVKHQRAPSGEILETLQYAMATNPTDTQARPEAIPEDAHYYYYRDLLGQVGAEIDAENYVTTYERLSNGLIHEKTRYAQKVDPKTVHSLSDIHPTPDPEDHATNYERDLLNRETARTEKPRGLPPENPMGLRTEKKYDAANKVTDTAKIDLKDLAIRRETHTRYNAWSQETAFLNPRASSQGQQESVWTEFAEHKNYDASGLCVWSTDARQNKTIYYYNDRRELVWSIDPCGVVTGYVRDAFNVTHETRYAKKIDAEMLKTLAGGFISAAPENFLEFLKELPDVNQDSTESHEFNRVNKETKTTDAEQYEKHREYNAFTEVEKIREQVTKGTSPTTWRVTKNTFDPRGLPASTTVDADDEVPVLHAKDNSAPHGETLDTPPSPAASSGGFFSGISWAAQTVLAALPFGSGTSTTAEADTTRAVSAGALALEPESETNSVPSEPPAPVPPHLNLRTQWTHTFLRKIETETDAEGNTTRFKQDHLGRTTDVFDGLNEKPTHEEWDAFNRETLHTDRTGAETKTVYETAKRQYTQTSAENRTLTTITNAFGEVARMTDSNNSTTELEHDPAGAVIAHVDANERRTEDLYNVAGWHETHTVPSTVVTKYGHDVAGHVTGYVENPPPEGEENTAHEEIEVTLKLDHLGLEKTRINPIKNEREINRDRRGVVRSEVIENKKNKKNKKENKRAEDPDFYITGYETDGLGNKTAEMRGDSKDPNQRRVDYPHDTAGRAIGMVTDPEGLHLEIKDRLNKTGAKIATTDPKGQMTRYILDGLNCKRFTVLPNGAVVRYERDPEGRILLQRAYAEKIDPTQLNDESTPDEVLALVKASPDDRVTYYRYDNDGKRLYKVEALTPTTGAVTQYHYDSAGRRIGETRYFKPINTSDLHPTDPKSIAAHLKPDSEHDRSEYHLLDPAGQEVFFINAIGGVTEYGYDANGNKTQIIRYATPLLQTSLLSPSSSPGKAGIQAQGWKFPLPSLDFVRALLNKSDPNNRVTHQIFDEVDRLRFIIDPEKFVVEQIPDEVNQVLTESAYEQPLSVLPETLTVESITAAIEAVPNQKTRTTTHAYDVLRNRTSTTNALNETEEWIYNALSECVKHKDRRDFIWENQYDKAGRKIHTFSPETLVRETQPDPNNPGHLILGAEIHARLVEVTKPDANGNPETRIRGMQVIGSTDITVVSTLGFSYDATNHATGTEQDGVSVDNPKAELKIPGDRPDVPEKITTQRVLNTFGQPVVEIDEAGNATFTVYDPSGRALYHVKPDGAVTHFIRNAFGDVEHATQYATPLDVTALKSFLTTGVTAQWVNEHLHPSNDDRTITMAYNGVGQKMSLALPEVSVYTQSDFDTPLLEKVTPTTEWEPNIFGEEIKKSVVLDGHGGVAVARTWRDVRGHAIGEASPTGAITIREFNCDGKETRRTEYAMCISLPAEKISFEELKEKIVETPGKDRVFRTDYDALGRVQATTEVQVVVQAVSLNPDGTPVMTDKPIQDLATTYTYPKGLDQPETVTYPNGGVAENKYDELGRHNEQSGIPRDDQEAPGQRLTEVRKTEFNVSNKPVYEVRSVDHTPSNDGITVLDHIPADQVTLRAFDPATAHLLKEQKPEGSTTETSYTKTGKVARQFQWVSSGDPSKKNQKYLYETKQEYDANGQPIRTIERDVQTGESIIWEQQPNTFGEVTQEGPGSGENPWPVQHRHNKAGQRWFTNEDRGIATIELQNAAGQQTGQLRSATDDLLTNITEADIPEILARDGSRTQRLGLNRDGEGRITTQFLPAFRYLPEGSPEALITCLSFEGSKISWPAPSDTFWVARFTLDRGDGNLIVREATRVTGADLIERFVVDFSDLNLIADRYAYTLNYYFRSPTGVVNYNPREGTKGQLTLDTSHTEGALHLATKLADEDTLVLTGKTTGIAGIALYPASAGQDKNAAEAEKEPLPVAKLGVNLTNVPGRLLVRCEDQVTGSYTAKPITETVKQGASLTLDQSDAQGRRVEFRKTVVRRNDDGPYEEVHWDDLPPGCSAVEGEFTYAVYAGGSKSQETYTLAGQPKTFQFRPDPKGARNYTGLPSGFLPVTDILYGTEVGDDPATRRVIGEAHNKYIAETEIPAYLYYKPAPGEQTEVLAVLDPNGNITGYLGLTEWLGGWKRAVFDESVLGKDASLYTYQALSLGDPDLARESIDAFDIITERAAPGLSAQVISMPDFAVVFSETNPTRFEWRLPKNLRRQPFQINYRLLNGMERSTWVGHDFLDKGGFYPGGAIPTKVVADWLFYDGQTIEALRGPEVARRAHDHAYYTIRSLLLHPIPVGTQTAMLEYFQKNPEDDSKIGWLTIPEGDYKVHNTVLIALVNGLDAGAYAFRVKFFDAAGHLLKPNSVPAPLQLGADGWTTGTFNLLDHPGDIVTPSLEAQYVWAKPERAQTLDRWGNPLTVTDPMKNTTEYEYNPANQRIKQRDPAVRIVDEFGEAHENYRALTQYGYDEMHRAVGVRKPKGGVTAQFRNTAGEITETVRPNKVSEKIIRDGFGRKWKAVDPMGGTTTFGYDGQDRLVSETDPDPGQDPWETTYGYNERDKRIRSTNPNKETTHFDYNYRDWIVLTQFPEGNRITRTFDRNGEVLTEDDGVSHPLTWDRDPFGNVQSHTDKATDKSGAPGALVAYQRDYTNQVTAIKTTRAGNHGKQYLWGNPAESGPVSPMRQRFVLDEAGHTRWVIDETQEWRTRYLIDPMGRRRGERFIGSDDQVYQDTYLSINARGWVTHIEDLRMVADYDFDEHGNRRHTQAWYKQLSADMNPQKTQLHAIDSAEQWFDYNTDDLMTIDRGVLRPGVIGGDKGKITTAPGKGTELIYDVRGWRHQEVSQNIHNVKETNTITYRPNGLIQETSTTKGTSRTYAYDRASRRTSYTELHADGSGTQEVSTPYDGNGRLLHQAHNSRGAGTDWVTDSTTRFSQFDSEGHPHHQETIYSPGEHQTTDELNSDYVGFDSMQITVNEGTRTQDGGKAEKHGTTYVTYDSNGNFQSVTGDLVHAGDFRWFRVNPENRIIFKQSDKRWEYFIYGPDGGVLAWVGDLPSDPTSADLPTEVNFDPWYHAVSANWPPSCPSQYTVREGDTFASIALQMYGDASCAYVIATANGYSESDAPPAEMVLTIPARTVVDEHNGAGQRAVYNPGQILGVLYPYMPLPPQHPHRNVFGILVEAFVGVLIVAWLAPELLGPLMSTFGNIIGAGLAFGIADAAADVAEQVVGLAFGMQDKFSLKEVGNQFEQGFITGALAGALVGTKLDILSGTMNRASGAAAGATTASGTTLDFPHLLLANEVMTLGGDAILVATGQKKGDMIWKDLVNGALSVAVNAGLNELPGGEARSSFLKTVVNSEASGFLEAVVTQDKFNAETAAAQAFGVYLGNAAAEKIQEKRAEEEAFKKQLQDNWKRLTEERYGYDGFRSEEDMATQFYAAGTDPSGGNPNPNSVIPAKAGISTPPMGASSHPQSTPRPKGPAFFGRSALDGEQAAQPAPQAQKQTRNDTICHIDWSSSNIKELTQADSSQAMTHGSRSELLTQLGVFKTAVKSDGAVESAYPGLGVSDSVSYQKEYNLFGNENGVNGTFKPYANAGVEINTKGLNAGASAGTEAKINYLHGSGNTKYGDYQYGVVSRASGRAEFEADIVHGGPLGIEGGVHGDLGAQAVALSAKGEWTPKFNDINLGIVRVHYSFEGEGDLLGVGFKVGAGIQTLPNQPGVRGYVQMVDIGLIGAGLKVNFQVAATPWAVQAYQNYAAWSEEVVEFEQKHLPLIPRF